MYTVYRHTCCVNGKSYYGFTKKTPQQRWIEHVKSANRGSGYYFHNAIRKYGQDLFVLEIVGIYENEFEAKNLEKLLIIRDRTHDFRFGYNLTLGGEGVCSNEVTRKKQSLALIGNKRNLGRKQSEETRRSISLSKIGKTRDSETRAKLRIANLGKKASQETRLKMRMNNKHTEEWKNKNSIRMLGNKYGVGQVSSSSTRLLKGSGSSKMWAKKTPQERSVILKERWKKRKVKTHEEFRAQTLKGWETRRLNDKRNNSLSLNS